MSMIIYIAVIVIGTWLFFTRLKLLPPKLHVPFLQFEGDNSASRYRFESEAILFRGYAKYIQKGLPFSMRDPDGLARPMVILPVKYLEEVKWIPENQVSFWKHIDKQFILPQIGGPSITEEVALAVRQGLNRALVYLIEPLQHACIAAFAKEMPSCPDWSSLLPYPVLTRIFTDMSACAIVGPELGHVDSEWQSLSMGYVRAVLDGAAIVKAKYPRWFYWLSHYTNDRVKKMRTLRARAAEILTPVLQNRIDATAELGATGADKQKGPRKYEDGVQWLLDAHITHGKTLTPEQLVKDLFVIMTASIHSTSASGLGILFDMLDHPEALSDITQEILQVQSKLEAGVWTRKALGDLRLLDSFMRESARVHSLTQYTAVRRVPVTTWKFKDSLEIPRGYTMTFPSYHHGLDPAIHPQPDKFDAYRHLSKRQESNTQSFQFASVSEDTLNWGAGQHACPGRFFAQETLKLLIIHLLTHYEFKHAEGTEGMPRFLSNNMSLMPNSKLPILLKERKQLVD